MKVRVPNNGMGGGNMANVLKQVQKAQEDMQNKQAELEEREYEVGAGGVVTVKINGKRELLELHIDPELVDPDDIETLSDTVIAAVNQAIRTVDETAAKEMAEISAQIPSIPGMPGMF